MIWFYVLKVKGMVNDMTETMSSSKEDSERPDRAAITAGRPYVDPSVKMNVCEAF